MIMVMSNFGKKGLCPLTPAPPPPLLDLTPMIINVLNLTFFRQSISRERQTIFFSNKSLVNKILLITFLMNSKSNESTYKMQRRGERGRWGRMMNLKYSLPSVVCIPNYVIMQFTKNLILGIELIIGNQNLTRTHFDSQ